MPIATVYLTRGLVDNLVAALSKGRTWQSFYPVLIFVLLMAAVLLLTELLSSTSSWVRTVQSELLKDYISGLIHNKSVSADLAFYESPEYFDHLHRAREEANYRPVVMVESVGSLLQNGITLLAMAAVLIPFGFWLPITLLVSTLPALYVVLSYSLSQHQWQIRTTADERRCWYFDWVLTNEETAAELRLFDLGGYFQSAYQKLRRRLRSERLQLASHQILAELGAGSFALLITGGAMAWMVWKAVRGLVTLGDLALFYQAFNQGQRLMHTLLENIGQLYSNSLFLVSLFEFLALKPRVVDPVNPSPTPMTLAREIRFCRIKFRYPGSQRLALHNFSLSIPAGKIVAIVGLNGAGKSTLVKLLCRFYDPQEGCIKLDGIDLRRLPILELRRLITVLFQEPVHYNTTVAENIALGDLAAAPDAADIEAAVQAAGADETIAHLPHGYHNLLGKGFIDGTELSVGEWQRIALARAFLRKASIIVLDEPTSAMDPWAEADWLGRFRRLAAGHTAIVITHRFTTAMRADIIHLMEEGGIIESGSHHELLARGGRYAQAWATQMREDLVLKRSSMLNEVL
jgi:ATP-binding cassette subfamily B protein